MRHHLLNPIKFIAIWLSVAMPCVAQNAMIPAEPIPPIPLDELRNFTQVLEHIRLSYVEPIDDKTLLEYAVHGMLMGLDPHSAYLNKDDFKAIQSSISGQFGGLGLEVTMEDGFIQVIAPLDNTPAAKAGIESGDLITKVDDQAVQGLSLREAVELMRGEKGSKITLTIVRKDIGQPLSVPLTRDIINVKSVRSKLLEPGYGYLRIAQFQNGTGAEFNRALQKLQAKDTALKGLIIDLRNNPGGTLQSAIEVTDALLTKGLIVYTEGRLAETNQRFAASAGDKANGIPVVVIINQGSASGAEIVAGALQDHRRALIIGTPSFGKGSVQTVIPLNGDQAIKLTTARYFTPNGRSIQVQGIIPDIEVKRANIEPLSARPAVSESDLKGHLIHGDGGAQRKLPPLTGAPDKPALAQQDNQLYEALNILKGVNRLKSL